MAVVRGTPPGGCGMLLTCCEAGSSLPVFDEGVETVGGPPVKAPLCLKINLL